MTVRRVLPVIAVAIAAVGFAPAAEWDFDPVLTVFTEYNDNVNLTDTQVDDLSSDTDDSDQITSGVLRLPLTARTPRTTFGLTYEPRYEKYHDSDHSQFDNSEHYVSARWYHRASTQWDWNMSGSWARRDRQRPSFDEPNIDLVIVPRTRFTTVNGYFGFAWMPSPRHRFTLTPSWRSTDYESLLLRFVDRAGDPTDNEPDGTIDDADDTNGDGVLTTADRVILFDDAVEESVEAAWEYLSGPITGWRVSYRGSHIDENDFGERNIHRGLVGYRHGSVEVWQIEINVGAGIVDEVRRAQPELFSLRPDEFAAFEEAPLENETEWIADLTMTGKVGARGSLTMGVSHDVSGSSGVSGASETYGGFLGLAVATGRWSYLQVATRYAHRNALEDDSSSSTTAVRAEWSAALGPHWAVVFSGERLSQSADTSVLEGAFTVLSAGLRWSPTATESQQVVFGPPMGAHR
ncbi:MAG: hypothetical protein KBD01_13295 [Acidobacteria bacterium]|nr:hypothetical protein [Acidobacteriota bacterium]